MFDALGAFCGTDCSAGCDTGSIRNRRPTEFGEESEEELSYALFECADNDGDVADAHAALTRPFRAAPPSPGSAPRRCEACGMSFSAAAFEAHASHCAKAPSPSRDDVLILRAARRARVDELYDAYDDSSGDDGAGAAAPPRDARFPEDPFAAAPRTPGRTPSETPSPPRTLDEWFDKPPSASPAERPFVAVGDRAAGDVRARLLARFPEDVFDDEPARVPAVSPDGGRAALDERLEPLGMGPRVAADDDRRLAGAAADVRQDAAEPARGRARDGLGLGLPVHGEHRAGRVDDLDAVVLDGVVARGDHDAHGGAPAVPRPVGREHAHALHGDVEQRRVAAEPRRAVLELRRRLRVARRRAPAEGVGREAQGGPGGEELLLRVHL